jgi:hypothetical protein
LRVFGGLYTGPFAYDAFYDISISSRISIMQVTYLDLLSRPIVLYDV